MALKTKLKNWFQIDFQTTYEYNITDVLQNTFYLIRHLKQNKNITKWFYLFEGETIRVRFKSMNKKKLLQEIEAWLVTSGGLEISAKYPFEPYCEDRRAFENKETMKTFANIMFEISELTLKKYSSGGINFDNYRFVERVSHCIHNNIYGTNTEEAFLARRLAERLSSIDTNYSMLEKISK